MKHRFTSRWIEGPSLCGFWGLFENDFGRPETDEQHITITPTRVGNVLLPFRCPCCKKIPWDLARKESREKYRDTRPGRDNYYCPLCCCRFKINLEGTTLRRGLHSGSDVGPSLILQQGKTFWQDEPSFWSRFFQPSRGGYETLATLHQERNPE